MSFGQGCGFLFVSCFVGNLGLDPPGPRGVPLGDLADKYMNQCHVFVGHNGLGEGCPNLQIMQFF